MELPQFSFKNNVFILALAGLAILFVYAIIVPTTTTYPFQTITKFQGNYTNPIYIVFHWESKDELMVGKTISVSANIIGLPYKFDNQTSKSIEMHFNGLNYFSSPLDPSDNKISKNDTLIFSPKWDKHLFYSNLINIRYIIPIDESVELCDYNLQKSCMIIPNIIHPAPHDTFVQIETGRANAGVSIAILLATIVIVWDTLAKRNPSTKTVDSKHHQKWFIIILVLSMAGAIIFEYWFKWKYGDLS